MRALYEGPHCHSASSRSRLHRDSLHGVNIDIFSAAHSLCGASKYKTHLGRVEADGLWPEDPEEVEALLRARAAGRRKRLEGRSAARPGRDAARVGWLTVQDRGVARQPERAVSAVLDLGSGRVAASEIGAPHLFANLG